MNRIQRMKFPIKRKWFNNLLDWLRFKFDQFPAVDYQPMPWLGIRNAKRASGVVSRWNTIKDLITKLKVESVIDIGCNNGFFSVSISKMGINVIGIESNPKYFRTYLYAIRKLGLENAGALSWKLTHSTLTMLPSVDAMLFLSVWHHIVREYGFDQGTDILRQLWIKTNKVFFFETGENEMPSYYHLPPMIPDPKIYLKDYLEKVCTGGKIIHLGWHDAFSPDGKVVKRNLFAAIKPYK
ncbi:MAG: hypothetical protein A3A81_02155 [Omnitrophica bacterium RIFCSPLOWO2_01_FULL_45_10b]|nr:MAG: hypothetical protein A3A81_02155 [Omnitrophica bacterium RIFCSPLOWO2_01_FULL_45_10b]